MDDAHRARWRDLPERFGKHQSVKRRYYRWIEMEVLNRIFEAVAAELDLEWVMLDATVIRAHAQATGTPKKGGTGRPRRLAALAVASEPSSTSA
jgi:transposase